MNYCLLPIIMPACRNAVTSACRHVVFTLPHEWNPLIMGNRKVMFKMLFDAASETLLNYGNNPAFLGAQPGLPTGQAGLTMILHTWGQALTFHPHVHCIVSGGGYASGAWVIAKRTAGNFIFPSSGLRKMYKAIFLNKIRQSKELKTQGVDIHSLIDSTGKKKWNVYAKAPFGSPATVIEYLGRYTHKIAITRHRIVSVTDRQVTFTYKDYADGNKTKVMALSREDFLHRFEQHILPKRFVKIRYYGYLQNRNKHQRLDEIRVSLKLEVRKPMVKVPIEIRMLSRFGVDILKCPCCEKGRLVLVRIVYPTTQTRNKASPLENRFEKR